MNEDVKKLVLELVNIIHPNGITIDDGEFFRIVDAIQLHDDEDIVSTIIGLIDENEEKATVCLITQNLGVIFRTLNPLARGLSISEI